MLSKEELKYVELFYDLFVEGKKVPYEEYMEEPLRNEMEKGSYFESWKSFMKRMKMKYDNQDEFYAWLDELHEFDQIENKFNRGLPEKKLSFSYTNYKVLYHSMRATVLDYIEKARGLCLPVNNNSTYGTYFSIDNFGIVLALYSYKKTGSFERNNVEKQLYDLFKECRNKLNANIDKFNELQSNPQDIKASHVSVTTYSKSDGTKDSKIEKEPVVDDEIGNEYTINFTESEISHKGKGNITTPEEIQEFFECFQTESEFLGVPIRNF